LFPILRRTSRATSAPRKEDIDIKNTQHLLIEVNTQKCGVK
jgi:hypothetical protein